jgi:hypothetical protein
MPLFPGYLHLSPMPPVEEIYKREFCFCYCPELATAGIIVVFFSALTTLFG